MQCKETKVDLNKQGSGKEEYVDIKYFFLPILDQSQDYGGRYAIGDLNLCFHALNTVY